MQFDASALFAVGAGVSDMLSLAGPSHIVITLLHFSDEICFGGTTFHCLTDVIHQLEFPTLSADSGTIFPRGDFGTAFFVRLQGGETMGGADLVIQLP